MTWIIPSTLVSGALAATGFAALFLAVWMAARLRRYTRGSHTRGSHTRGNHARGNDMGGNYTSDGRESPASGLRENGVPPSSYDFASLLSDEDFDFLATLPGYKPEIGEKLQCHHEQILRLYLRELAREFHNVHAEAREAV